MYRLTIISGPNRGATFRIVDGEFTIGRHQSNNVVLPSSRISKRHCVLMAGSGKVLLRDQGSANGTFVNGVLTASRSLRHGDRIGIGEYVLEISAPRSARAQATGGGEQAGMDGFGGLIDANGELPASPGPADGAQLAPFGADGGHAAVGTAAQGGSHLLHAAAELAQSNAMPQDLKGKAFWAFENYVMPIFYGLNLKYEWKYISAAVFGGFLLLNLLISVQPLMDENRAIILQESARRARFIAEQAAERNAPALTEGAETRTDLGTLDTAEGVNLVALTDLDQRIIAPASKMNQYLVAGPEARVASRAALLFRQGREVGVTRYVGDLVVAVEPIKIFNPKLGKNAPVAMAVVSVDGSSATLGMGEIMAVYSHTLIITGILGGLMLLILYRLTLKPFHVLNDDMDKALKGDLQQVTHEFKCEELNPLWDLFNSALQRIPRSTNRPGDGGLGMGGEEKARPDQFIGPMGMLAEAGRMGLVIFGSDRKIAYMNEMFEELSGIHADAAVGQEISALARDQSLGVLVQDLLDRCLAGGDPQAEDYEFSGVGCTVRAAAFGEPGEMTARAYAMTVERKAE